MPKDAVAERTAILKAMLAAATTQDDDRYAELYDLLIAFEKHLGDFDNPDEEELQPCALCTDFARWQLTVPGVLEGSKEYQRYACFSHYDQVVAQLDADPAVAGKEPVISICDFGWPAGDPPDTSGVMESGAAEHVPAGAGSAEPRE